MSWALDLAKNYVPKEGSVPVFGIILYTNAHANIKKILRDADYWAALDEISGPKWPVFSIRALKGKYEYPTPPPGVRAMMLPVWKEPRENLTLLNLFKLKNTENFPCLAIFTISEKEEVDRIIISLNDKSPDSAFNRLREIMTLISKAIDGVKKENLSDGHVILSTINNSLKRYGHLERLKKGYKILKEIKSWLPI